MRYLITSVPMSTSTRRRTGKATVEVYETSCVDPRQVEAEFENRRRGPNGFRKVVDVREAPKTGRGDVQGHAEA